MPQALPFPFQRGHVIVAALSGFAASAVVIASGAVDSLRAGALEKGLHLDEPLMLFTLLLLGVLIHGRIRRRQLMVELKRRQRQERDARALALRDPLTGLLNRRAISDISDRHRQSGGQRALLLCDLDGFKQVNDTYGHAAGDLVLRDIAARLSALNYEGVSLEVVRLGGDEFVLLAAGQALDASAIARDVLRTTAQPFAFEGTPVACSISVGIATASNGEATDDLLGMADDAMYEAKRNGLPVRVARDPKARNGHSGRRMFEQQLDMRSTERTLFAAAIGIDRIDEMRRALGYGLGSKLVRELTQRLGLLDENLCYERLSSDVLGVAFTAPNRDAAREILERLRTSVEGPACLAGASIDVRLTAGLAGPGAPPQIRDLTEQAQAALDQAWRSGARLASFEEGDQAAASENIGLMADLRAAIESDALDIFYQPKLRIANGEIEGVEALVRWDHPALGAIPPNRFVPIAEKTGDIHQLTNWVIARVLADQALLGGSGNVPTIYVNISAQLISDEKFAKALIDKLTPLNGSIGIEITETAVIANPERALPHLNQLAAAGVKIAIDDYGVGVSSLAYLKQLPASELKIDMLFVSNLATSHRDPMIVRSTIELAHGLGLSVTAEGVDSMDALALLQVMGCDVVQGFSIAKPMPLIELSQFLATHQAGHSLDGSSQYTALLRQRLAQAA